MKKLKLWGVLCCSLFALACVALLAGCATTTNEPAGNGEAESETVTTNSADEPTGESNTTESSSTEPAVTDITTVQDGKLIIQSDCAYAPMEYVPEGKTAADAEGFDVDLVDAIAKKLGLTPEWQQVQFDTIIPAVKQGDTVDLGVSSFTITDERLQEVDFSNPYMDSNQAIVMQKATTADVQGFDASQDIAGTERLDAIKAYLDNADMKIAVQSGTTGETWSEENLTKATTVPLADTLQCLTGLQSGLYNAVIADYPVMAYYCQESYTDCEVVAAIPTGEQYGIVVSKDNPQLLQAINQALEELTEDGTVEQLQQKWFGSASSTSSTSSTSTSSDTGSTDSATTDSGSSTTTESSS